MRTSTETKTLKLLAGAAVATIALVGCSKGATVAIGDGRGSAFCTDVATFKDQASALEVAAGQDLKTLRTQADLTRDQLVALQKEANAADRVNGHAVKDDLQTAVDTYKALAGGLDSADASDPNAVGKVLAGVQGREGGAFTAATGRLDSYTKKGCGISVTTATTSTTSASTTAAAAPTTLPSSTTTVAPVGPVISAPSTTAAP